MFILHVADRVDYPKGDIKGNVQGRGPGGHYTTPNKLLNHHGQVRP